MKKPILILIASMLMMVMMLIAYSQYLKDKPLIEEQNRQAQQQSTLTPDQMVSGIKQFLNDTTSTIKPPPPIP